jgi:dienelactone hydrolase
MKTLLLLSVLWGQLQPGPHAVGYARQDRYDRSRPYRTAKTLDGKARTGERARPIRISIWYPARASSAKPLTFGDYLRGEEAAIFGLQGLARLDEQQRAKLQAMPSRAVRDAKPVSGKFPLILYSLGSPSPAHVTPEYLASHGYFVVQAPRLGAWAGFPADNRDALDLETKLRDMDFVLNAMKDFPQADLSNIGAIGFSAGGRWALAAAMKSPDVKAVVSLDSVMLYDDPVTAAWRTMPHFNLDAVRAPILHLTSAAFAKGDDAKMWEALRHADRTAIVYDDPALNHWDFQSLGYATALAGARGADAEKVASAFHSWNRETLAFLDAHLKGGTYKPSAKATHLAALPAPIAINEFMNALEEEGTDAAIAAYRAAWKTRGEPPVPEATVNVAGYNLLFGGRPADGLRLLALNAEAWPQSANTYDSLADAYVFTGDRAKALELTKKANELLAKETALTPERRAAIQGSIDQKLRDLR